MEKKTAISYKQIIKEEYKRCAKSIPHFLRKYSVIQHPTKGKIYFNLYDFQEKALDDFLEHRFNIVLKSRQLGLSTLVAGYVLHCLLFKRDYNVLIIATKQDVAKNLVTKIRVMHEGLPKWLQGETVEDNKLSLRFRNGSQVKAVASSEDAGRSEALSLLVLDEAAFIDKATAIWTSAQQTLAEGGSAIILSTPNGTGNLFHSLYKGAEDGENQFNYLRLPWQVHPHRDQSWRDDQTKLLGEQMSAQECDASFISSGNSVIPGELLQYYEDTFVEDPIEKRGFDGNLWIWKYVDYTKNYIVCADVARGDSNDYSACHVLDVESLEQVAEYRGKVGTTEYGNFLVSLATEYNNALLVIENANVGWAVCQVAIDRKYENLFYTYKNDPYMDESKHLKKAFDLVDKSKMVPGFITSTRTRPLLISKLELYFQERSVIVHSIRTINEAYVFIWKNGKPQAQEGYHDDLIMSLGIGLWIRDTALKLRQRGIELNRKGMTNVHKSVLSSNYNQSAATDAWKINSGKGESEDITWLL